MLQAWRTSFEGLVTFLVNLPSFVDFEYWAFHFDFLFQPLLKMAHIGWNKKIEVKGLMFEVCRAG